MKSLDEIKVEVINQLKKDKNWGMLKLIWRL